MKIPGVDPGKLLEGRRKDIEAVLAANERAFVAVEELTRKQTDLVVALVKEWQATAKDAIGPAKPADKLGQVAAHAQHAFASALTTMKEMAEIAARSNHDVVGILNQRYHEGLDELRSRFRQRT